MFHADGQTDMAKLIVAFRTFTNVPTNKDVYCYTMICGPGRVTNGPCAYSDFSTSLQKVTARDSRQWRREAKQLKNTP